MKKFFFLLAIVLGIYAANKLIPDTLKTQALTAAGIPNFFQRTLPNFLRQHLSIPESPVAKRKKILDQAADNLARLQSTLETVSPAGVNSQTLQKPLSAQKLHAAVEKSQDLAAGTQALVGELTELNSQSGTLQALTTRALDKVLPPSPLPPTSPNTCPEK